MTEINQKLSYKHFDSICRICLQRPFILKPIFNECENEISTADKILIFLNLTVTVNDGLPGWICTICFDKLENCMKFRTSSKVSFDVLEKIKLEYENNKDLEEKGESSDDNNYENNMIYVSSFDIKYPSDDENTIKLFKQPEPAEPPSPEPQTPEPQPTKKNKKLTKKKLKPEDSEESDSEKIIQEKKVYNRTRMCQICGTMQKGLKAHMATHSGERAFECGYCGKMFTQRGNLRRHIDIHTDNRRYKCELCEKAFTDPKSLTSHMVTHTKIRKYVCDICSKSFGYSHTLNTHKKIHTQDRKFQCTICQKFFLTRYCLQKHFRIHSKEKPFKCEICSKGFTTSSNLTIHRRVHNKLVSISTTSLRKKDQ